MSHQLDCLIYAGPNVIQHPIPPLRIPSIHPLPLRKRPPPTGVKTAKIRKRGFRGQKTPISQCPRNGRFESKNPHFSTGLHRANGDSLTQNAISGTLGNGSFLTPKPSFPDFGDFDPCRGRTLSQPFPQKMPYGQTRGREGTKFLPGTELLAMAVEAVLDTSTPHIVAQCPDKTFVVKPAVTKNPGMRCVTDTARSLVLPPTFETSLRRSCR